MFNGDNNLTEFGNFSIDTKKKILWYGKDVCDVPVKSVELLCTLIDNAGEVVSKGELLDSVWEGSFVEESVLSQNVYFLRKLFREYGVDEDLIQTVPRRGYRFVGELNEHDDELIIEKRVVERRFITERELPFSSHDGDSSTLSSTWDDHSIKETIEGDRETSIFSRSRVLRFVLGVPLLFLILGGAIFVAYSSLFSIDNSRPGQLRDNTVSYQSLSESGRVVSVGLSPDDQNAVYVVNTAENKYEMILHHLPTASETKIIQPQDGFIASIRFSPDGSFIYYNAPDAGGNLTVYRMPLYGGLSQPVLRDLVNSFSVSPDGEWIAFFRRVPAENAHYLEVARSSDGSERRTVAIRGKGEWFSIWGTAPTWSPDGSKLIAVGSSTGEATQRDKRVLLEIDAVNGRQTIIKTPTFWRAMHEPYYSRDGQSIFLKVRERIGEPVQIRQIVLNTGEIRKVTNDTNDFREFRLSSNGEFLITATWARSENLFLFPIDDPSRLRQLTFDAEGQNGVEGIAWTPDGKGILFTKNRGFGVGNIWLIDVETGGSRQVTNEEASQQFRIDVTPDGQTMVYSSNSSGSIQVWRQDLDGNNRRQLTDEKKGVDFSEISQDGQWIYYAGNGLRKIPIGGGEPIKLMDATPGRVHFSPTAPSMFAAYFFDDKKAKPGLFKHVIFDLNDPSNFKDLRLIGSGGRADWTPDGQKIYFIGKGESFNNIWTVSPFTLEQEQVTNFQDQRIANASLSPDGKHLAISRGMAIGRILKINLN